MFTEEEQQEQREISNPFAAAPVVARPSGAVVEVEQQRAIAETQAAMIIAKRFPRDQAKAMDAILQACARPSLAESALYSYARGGTEITGPSIRLAEAMAQCWQNLQFGVREISQKNGESEVETFCWDVESNTRQVKVFRVPHLRYTRGGTKKLDDPRDIYELVANQGARRLRACILGIIPGDVIDAAVRQCDATMKTKAEVTPERLKGLLEKFAEFSVTREQIEKRVQRHLEAITPALLVQLGKIYTSMKDGMSVAADWFEAPPGEAAEAAPEPASRTEAVKDRMRQRKAQQPPETPAVDRETGELLPPDAPGT